MKTELSKEDRERIEQEGEKIYGAISQRDYDDCNYLRGFKKGAEYENNYQREQQAELQKEINDLRAWKQSEITIWRPIIEFMHRDGHLLGLRLGESISDKVLEVLKLNSLKK